MARQTESRENQQFLLQRRREQRRARLERETPGQSELRRQARRRQSQKTKGKRENLAKTSNFVLRDDVSKDEQGLNVKSLNSLS